MSERRPACPAHAQDMHEDEDERPLRSGIIPLSLMMEVTNHLCSQYQGKKLRRKGVTQLLMTETLHPGFLQDRLQLHRCEEEKGLPVWTLLPRHQAWHHPEFENEDGGSSKLQV